MWGYPLERLKGVMVIIEFIKIIISFLISLVNNKYNKVWFISERGTDARDNGYFFYEYLKSIHPDIPKMYCITPDSVDVEKISSDNIIKTNSIMHGVLYFSAKYLISTHPYGIRPKWKGLDFLERTHVLRPHGKRVFLQHGITKDFIHGLTADRLDIDLFCCGAYPEYEYIKKNFGYEQGIVQYTGFARFDNLYRNRNNMSDFILVMPTWRTYLADIKTDKEFKNTEYFKKYNELLNNDKLISFLNEHELKLIFYPHYEIQKWIHTFQTKSSKIEIADMGNFDVQKLLIKCRILVTDYSSVFFDVAYMGKPVIFYQFDYAKYRETNYKNGFYDYSRGLGPVEYNKNELLKSIFEVVKNGMDPVYKDRIDGYYKLYDDNNSKRIYERIVKLV